MKPLHYYFSGTASWFFAYGIQTVVFAWLVTIVLDESPDKVGFAQMAFLLPATLFMLVGGSLADQVGGRIVAIWGQLLAALSPLFLIVVMWLDVFSYTTLIVAAIIMGCAQAMVTPARDGLLALVAGGQIQRLVVKVSMIQFGVQMLGFAAASVADRTGAIFILGIQFVVMLLGVVAYYFLSVPAIPSLAATTRSISVQLVDSIGEGYRSVAASPSMRMIVLQNCAMGVFFMGSYIVTLPLLLRELYDGGSQELSWMNAANSAGLVFTIMLLLRFGDIHRQGRALLLSQGIGAVVLATAALGLGFFPLVISLFCWGLCGGFAMTMSRTIMQEQAPPNQRARMMAFYAFSFMGSGPVGALLNGYLVEWFGPVIALTCACVAMLAVVILIGVRSNLWKLAHTEPPCTES